MAYGNLLSAYSGFVEANGRPGDEPRTGLAWADPLCGLFMAFAVVAALDNRDRGGGGRHVDFSMLEGLLWTMPGALVAAQSGREFRHFGNGHPHHVPHNVFRAEGDDAWLAIAVTRDEEWRALCSVVPALKDFAALGEHERLEHRDAIEERLRAWVRPRNPIAAMDLLQAAGVPASASYTTNDMFEDAHLWERAFYHPVVERDGTPRMLPGLPWRWGDGELVQPHAAPALGEHSEYILRELAGLTAGQVASLSAAGAFGSVAGANGAPR